MIDIRGSSTNTESKRSAMTIAGARVDHRRFDATYSYGGRYERKDFKDVGSQYEGRRGDFVSKTNRVNCFTTANQLYRYQGSRNVEDVGVGSVKAVPRKRVKKIYLPETDNNSVECTDLSTYFRGKQKTTGYYEYKKTSSKCVGDAIESTKEVLNEKSSPIVKTKSGTTSPKILANNMVVPQTNVISNTPGKKELEKVEILTEEDKCFTIQSKSPNNPENNLFIVILDKTAPDQIEIQNKACIKINKISSVIFLQCAHNLETSSNENNVEIEYSNKCSNKIDKQILAEHKPISEFKSTSFLRSRFEALRRGLGKKRDLKNNSVLLSGTARYANHKDASIASDPPSYSNTKVYSPYDFSIPKCKTNKNPLLGDKEVSECRSVKNMFNFWGTKFNFVEDPSKKKTTDLQISNHDSNDSKFVKPEKKSGKKFSFFRKKSKNKTVTDRPKKGVTAGRCEGKDGMTMELEAKVMKPIQEITDTKPEQDLEDYVDKLRRAWLQKFIFTNNYSRRCVKIRWKNKKCATSSSTIFESMDNVFKETGVVFRSQSDTTFTEESAYQTFRKPKVNFIRHVEAWVVPNTMTTSKVPREEKEIANTKHNALLPRNIKLVLHSKNFVRINNSSSDCLKINIPKGFFSDSEDIHTSSDEKVYNVVEYETINSVSANKIIKQRGSKGVQTDYVIDSFEKIKEKPPVHRDVMLQGSEVDVAKRCDVIDVGIISQRDIREIKNATMRIQDEFTDYYESVDRLYESNENLQSEGKKCKFADSYLHDYYRQWTRLGIDLFSWRVSDPYVRGSSENLSHSSEYDQGDESKSCPNICDDFQTSVIVSSCTSSCHDLESQKPKENVNSKFRKFFKKSKKRSKSGSLKVEVRVLPKDSKEVFKSRKVYAKSNRSQWLCPDDKSYSVTSNECKSAQENCSKCKRISYQPDKGTEKICEKRVSSPGSLNNKKNKKQFEGILPFKGSPTCVPSTPEELQPQFPSLLPQQSSGQSPRQSKRQLPCQLSRQSPQRSPCQSPQLKTSLLPTQNYPNTTLGSAPTPKCLPKFPNMSPSTSPKSKIPIKSSPRKTQYCNNSNCPNKDFPPTCSGSRDPLKTSSPHVCFKCKNLDCCKITPKKIVKKRSSNSSSCPCVGKKSNKITEKKESPTKNKSNPCPTSPLTKKSIPPPEKSTPPRSKIGGFFLKLKPSQKKSCCSKECLGQGSNSNIIRINSKEKITIRMKRDTPSTQEIKDGYDIKVKDEDGITLYEKKQYKSYQPNFGDVFKGSNIRRLSTHSPIQNPAADKVLDKSDLSILNLLELQLNLKFPQGDKTTEINMGNDDNTQKDTEDKIQSVKESSRDVYAFTENDEDNEKYVTEGNIPTNDINIRILIKNLKPKVEKKCDYVGNDRDYYRNITEKFQSVSAASSPIQFNQNPEICRDLSVHRANVDLSLNESKIKPSQAIVSDGLTDNDHYTVSTLGVRKKYGYKQSFSRIKNNDILLESILSGTDSTAKFAKELQLKFNFGKDIVSSSKTKYRNRANKKEHLKMVMEETSLLKKSKNKAKIIKLNNTLKSILTSDSETDEIAVASSELIREMTCASLRRKFLTKLDSMGNYYNVGGYKVNQLYPFKKSNINDSFSSKEAIVCEGCLCSTFARKLPRGNGNEGACCCRNPQIRSETVVCDVMSEEKTNDNEETSILEPEYFQPVQEKTMSALSVRNESTEKSRSGLVRTFVPREDDPLVKEFKMKKLNPSTLLGVTNVTNEDEVNTEANRAQVNQINISKMSKFVGSFRKSQVANYVTSSNILQSYDVKKAVLNIYAEKTVTSDGEHLVARLPKFV